MDETGTRAKRGSGGIRYRADKDIWIASETVTLNGKRTRLEATGKTETKARAAIAKKRNEFIRGKKKKASRGTVTEWLNKFTDEIAIHDIRPGTMRSYKSVINNHIIPTIGDKKLAALEPADVRTMRDEIMRRCEAADKAGTSKRKGAGPSRARYAQTVLSVALARAVQDEVIDRNVANKEYVKKLPAPDKAVAALDADQAKRFLRDVARSEGTNASRWAFAFLTGARQGEILGLEINRLDFTFDSLKLTKQLQILPNRHGCGEQNEDGTWPCGKTAPRACKDREFDISPTYAEQVKVLHGSLALVPTKTKMSKRDLPMVGPLKKILQAHLEATAHMPNPHGLVWRNEDGSPLQPRSDFDTWSDALTKSGFDHIKLHSSRSSTASIMSDMGIDREVIAEILGHTNLETTAGYVAVGDKFRRDALGKVGGALMLELFGDDDGDDNAPTTEAIGA